MIELRVKEGNHKKDSEKVFNLKKFFSLAKIELVPVMIIISTFVINIIYYPKLPFRIPIHFNIKGIPDGWASKSTIFILPCIMIVVYLITLGINLFVNKRRMYFNLYLLYTSLLLLFGALDWGSILIVLGKIKNLNIVIGIPVILLLLSFVQLLIFSYKKNKPSEEFVSLLKRKNGEIDLPEK